MLFEIGCIIDNQILMINFLSQCLQEFLMTEITSYVFIVLHLDLMIHFILNQSDYKLKVLKCIKITYFIYILVKGCQSL